MASETPNLIVEKDKAEAIVSKIREDDTEWTYEVVPFGVYFAIKVYDETGAYLGYL